MTINQLIESKKNVAQAAAKANEVRFMLVLTEETRELLRDLSDQLGVQQIKFASEIFTIALQQANAAANPPKAEAK